VIAHCDRGCSVTLAGEMRAAAILGPGCSPNNLKPFQTCETVEWRLGLPDSADGVEVILLFGGDGTIHHHLGKLVALGVPVLIVPTGSGNDFARTLGLRKMRDSIAAWQQFCAGRGKVRAVDLGVITEMEGAGAPHDANRSSGHSTHLFCGVAGLGLDSEVARRANTLPRWLRGHGGYAIALLPTIFRFAAFPLKIFTASQDGNWRSVSDQPTILAAFANIPTYGGGMKIAPRGLLDDGQLDVCVIGSIDPFRLACLFPTVYFGGHLSMREVNYFHAAHLRVETETPLDVYADGEYVCRTPIEISMQPGALKVIAL
jgi:diacylglycerol kinase (ATP)